MLNFPIQLNDTLDMWGIIILMVKVFRWHICKCGLVAIIIAAISTQNVLAQETGQAGAGDSTTSYMSTVLFDYGIDGAAHYRTDSQLAVANLLAAGESDVFDLVSLILEDNSEVLDHLIVNLSTQEIYECNSSGEVLHTSKVSSGTVGHTTPLGEYNIVNRALKAYSEKYESWMLHWMGLTKNGEYGMHGLEGSSYERRLGRIASHGCVRLSRAYASDLYTRVQIGMPVKIVDDPNLELQQYRPLTPKAAHAMVLEWLSPTDPWEVFY